MTAIAKEEKGTHLVVSNGSNKKNNLPKIQIKKK